MKKFLVFLLFFVEVHARAHTPVSFNIEERSSPLFDGDLGLRVEIGYLWKTWKPDFRLTLGSMRYSTMQAIPSASLTPTGAAIDDPGSELNRIRNPNDPWSYRLFEPGLSVAGKFLQPLFSNFTEQARFGAAFGRFTDKNNALSFSATLFSFEAALAYALKEESHWELTGAFSYHFGILTANEQNNTAKSLRRLPIHFYSTTLGILYWF